MTNLDLLAGWLGRHAVAADQMPHDAEDRVERALIAHGASPALISSFRRKSYGFDDPSRLLARFLKESFGFSSVAGSHSGRIMLVGAPAAGKSSITAKLAARGGDSPMIFSTDTDRPGGMMRLAEYLSVLDIEPIAVPSMGHLAEIEAAAGWTIIDTEGVDAGDRAALACMGQLARAVSAEIVMVASALSDADEMRDLANAAIGMGAKRVMISRLDMARRFGTILAIAETGLALCEASITANFAYGIRPLTPLSLAERMLRETE